jgi:hypothetical protein
MSAHPTEDIADLRTLEALAKAALPAGKILQSADRDTALAANAALQELPESLRIGYRALVKAFEIRTRLKTGRSPAELSSEALMRSLRRASRGGFLSRSSLRLLLAPLKAAHFADPSLYDQLGCTFDFGKRNPEALPRLERERCHDGTQEQENLSLEVDVVVVGTGAGGAVAAYELARAGLAVAMVEEGDFLRRHQFTGRPFAMQKLLYRDYGATATFGNTVIPVPLGKSVGGTTTINSGTCYRTPERVLVSWASEHGLDLSPETMAPYFDEVEAILQVARAEPRFVGGVGRVVARGCERLGIDRHGPLNRNAPDCDGQGLCSFGCPTDAKRSTNVSYVPLALKAGAELFTAARVESILVEGGKARGVRAVFASGQTLELRSRAVVLGCGALLTPLLMAAQGLGKSSGLLGANLTIHPAQGVLARFGERIASYAAIPQGYAIEEFHDEGLLFEGASTPLDLTMVALPMVGPELIELAENFDQVASFGFMIEDKCVGRVLGKPGSPRILYRLGKREIQLLSRGIELLCRVFFAAGAESVYPMLRGFERLDSPAELDKLRSTRLRARDFELSAYHPVGTAKMGASPSTSVLDPSGMVHDTEGLYVMDGSCLPSSPAVNPQVTIMALATRNARRLAQRLCDS